MERNLGTPGQSTQHYQQVSDPSAPIITNEHVPNNTELISVVNTLEQGGNPNKATEDSVEVLIDEENNCATILVADGASDIKGYRTPDGMTGGAVASQILANTVRTATHDMSPKDILLEANGLINDIQRDQGLDPKDKEARFCTTAAIVKIREDEEGNKVIDLAQIADAVALVVYEDGRVEAPLGLYDHDVETMELWQGLIDEGLKGDDILNDPRMQAQIASKRREQNDSYGVLNGEAEAEHFIKEVTIPAQDVKRIITITDGAFAPKEDPHDQEDWSIYEQLYEEGGVEAIQNFVRSVEATDPDLTRYPRFKVGDDMGIAVVDL